MLQNTFEVGYLPYPAGGAYCTPRKPLTGGLVACPTHALGQGPLTSAFQASNCSPLGLAALGMISARRRRPYGKGSTVKSIVAKNCWDF